MIAPGGKPYNFKIDVEAPYEEPETISVEQAVDEYLLDDDDLYSIERGHIVWLKGTALSKHEEEED